MRVLVAGIGNIFFGDDGFGVAVAEGLGGRVWPPGVEVAEYGIRGVHLAYHLLDGYDALVLVDAVPMGDDLPGTLAVIEVDLDATAGGSTDAMPAMDAHTMHPAVVIGMLTSMGGTVGRMLVVGCQPGLLDDGIGLSDEVQAAVEPALDLVTSIVDDLLATEVASVPSDPSDPPGPSDRSGPSDSAGRSDPRAPTATSPPSPGSSSSSSSRQESPA